ncbi:hypothetical protein B0H16DRAFT_1696104 [Mycena metata]|uniref:TNT domain-containing protein n=1 Tax=Mycena metata TaxID=1033252 RepID=A0AAD7I2J4_9AGAR|nr:hypothetical protein B0H16DRAFT_1696270 [Mycena metata]KAJ7733670.1 hypothetical protein B0H16DRAFT_1696104 [Mycena metata]
MVPTFLAVISLALLVIPGAVAIPLADCNCTGTINTDSTKYLCGDARLGPFILPEKAPFSHMLYRYDPFGGLCPGEFLSKWTFANNNSYRYPDHDTRGFQISTTEKTYIDGNETLVVGMLLDRFGPESGKYLAPAYTPFAQRSLPPLSLNDSDYHVYKVTKNFTLLSGPTAAWFGQPGQGTQYWSGNAVKEMISAGNLTEVAI